MTCGLHFLWNQEGTKTQPSKEILKSTSPAWTRSWTCTGCKPQGSRIMMDSVGPCVWLIRRHEFPNWSLRFKIFRSHKFPKKIHAYLGQLQDLHGIGLLEGCIGTYRGGARYGHLQRASLMGCGISKCVIIQFLFEDLNRSYSARQRNSSRT